MFDSRQYEWADMSLILGGVDIAVIRAIKYTIKAEKEALYGKGRNPLSIQTGNIAIEGEIVLLQSGVIALEKGGGGSILGISTDGIIGYGNPSLGDVMTTDRIVGISFTEVTKEMKQGDKNMEVTLPFIALMVKNQA